MRTCAPTHHANQLHWPLNLAAITLAIWPRIIDGALRKSDVLSQRPADLHLGGPGNDREGPACREEDEAADGLLAVVTRRAW